MGEGEAVTGARRVGCWAAPSLGPWNVTLQLVKPYVGTIGFSVSVFYFAIKVFFFPFLVCG